MSFQLPDSAVVRRGVSIIAALIVYGAYRVMQGKEDRRG